jgi:PAS domain S-box-containing protein
MANALRGNATEQRSAAADRPGGPSPRPGTLRASLAQLQTLFNEMPLGAYLVDADFRVRQVNPVAMRVFGDIPDLIGRDFDEVIHILWEEEYADEIVRQFRHTLETGDPYVVSERAEQRRDRDEPEYYEWQISRIPL